MSVSSLKAREEREMRKFLMSAVIATVAAVSFAAPSQAGGFYFGVGGHGWGHHHGYSHYHGHHRHCFWKKVKRHNKWGHVVFRTVRVCR
jgi:hypothetical protein